MRLPDTQAISENFLRLPEDINVLIVDDEDSLQQAGDIVNEAYICALDAEWEPFASKPCASLVQAAIRTRSGQHVLLLDFEALHKPDLRHLLQRIFRAKEMLKVGYGLVMDLWAIAAALGGEGAGCISVVDPFIDVSALHRALYSKSVPGIAKVEGKGLAGLVEAQLGRELDKRLQCSAWSQRPLHPDQVAYAALDAAVLLLLHDSFIAAALPPPPPPPLPAAPNCTDGALHAVKMQDSGAVNAEQGRGLAAEAAERAERAGSCMHRDGSGEPEHAGVSEEGQSETVVLNAAAPTSRWRCQGASKLAEELLRSCLLGLGRPSSANGAARSTQSIAPNGIAAREDVSRAAEAWGIRLEVGGSGAKQKKKDRQPTDRKLVPGKASGDDEIFGWPAVIPWQGNGGSPRFACDVMTEGLARQLRLCGLDATTAPEVGKNERTKVYRHLVTTAKEEGRVILTADTTFLRARYTDRGYLVRANSKREQLAEVLTAFNIKVEEDDLLSRCTRCNGTFIPRPLTRAELPPTCDIPERVHLSHTEFWMCNNESCHKVYWQGFQYGNAMKNLTDRILGSSD